ncbi:MAG: DUF4397 domain-containing protein [Caldilineaceae bacterium]|nr:DUF4397 domain-containing protein [Caldilineaceae bacterium]
MDKPQAYLILRRFGFAAIFILLLLLTSIALLPRAGVAVEPAGATLPSGTVPPPLLATITVIHAAPFSSTVAATAVDFCDETGDVITELAGLVYRDDVTVTVAPGTYDWQITEAGSNCTVQYVDLPAFTVPNGGIRSVVFIGDGTNQPLEGLVITSVLGGVDLYMPLVSSMGDSP